MIIFTRCQAQVLELICKGLTHKEIAFELNRSMHTVVLHRSAIVAKTGLHVPTNIHIFIWAIENGYVKAPKRKI